MFENSLPTVTARKLACLAGKIISLGPYAGPIVQLKSQFLHFEIVKRVHWDHRFNLPSGSGVIEEVFFRKRELLNLNKLSQ